MKEENTERKIYKGTSADINRMFPGDPKGSPDDSFSNSYEETLVFIDEGFLDKLTKLLGGGKRIKFDKFDFAKRIAEKQGLSCKHLFYYTCQPFQSSSPNTEEIRRKRGQDKFVASLRKNSNVTVREGRVQRIINEQEEVEFKQKGADTLLTIDLSHIHEDFPEINTIILVTSDTDFCPIIKDIKLRRKINVILYSYLDKKRKSKFSLSNELIKCCSKYVILSKEDFNNSPLKIKKKEDLRE